MSTHLPSELISALTDGELSSDQLASVNAHLAECPTCTSTALFQSLLKSATARAGQRYAPSAQLQQRLARLAKTDSTYETGGATTRSTSSFSGFSFAGWVAAAVLLLAVGTVFLVQRYAQRNAIARSESAAFVRELADQHIAALATIAPPQILSSDRHTVKPWFQGKLPFSFNLPENLPADAKLDGANLTYLHSEPAALLLYHIGNHRVSVFVRQNKGTDRTSDLSVEHAGFHVSGFSTSDLEVVAVSDVDPKRLSDLVATIRQVQTDSGKSSR